MSTDTPTPSEIVDDALDQEALEAELLGDLPALLPAYRFRIGHRAAFDDLMLEAQKSGAFDRDNLDYDFAVPQDIEDFQKLRRFIVSIDAWAETIATDKDAYTAWSEGKTEEHFLALFNKYKAELGESRGSAN